MSSSLERRFAKDLPGGDTANEDEAQPNQARMSSKHFNRYLSFIILCIFF